MQPSSRRFGVETVVAPITLVVALCTLSLPVYQSVMGSGGGQQSLEGPILDPEAVSCHILA